ncbi:TonB-dependent receptor, partial [Pyrinomonas sp.]|uniref:TonB-dependent receptor n=1 Tax=Pyrinomonas sp. TaxID=2080306 RepID=UPI00332EAF9F
SPGLPAARSGGPVDVAAGVRRSTFETILDRKFGERASLFLRGSYFAERRSNGTPLQTNQTRARQLNAGSRWAAAEAGDFDLRAYLSTQVYDQNFSAVAADRRMETLTRVQRSPSQALGAALQWAKTLRHQTLVAGTEARQVRGASDETLFSGGRPTSLAGASGKQRTMSLFAEDLIRIAPRAVLTVALRYDRWRNFDALRATRPIGALRATVDQLTERKEAAFSPRLSLFYQFNERLALTGSAYRAFRAPTLNELYRSFRVGDVLTLANPDLRAERLTGGEAGTSYAREPFSARAVFFWSEITRSIANVTISVAPTLITRQRQNLGRTRAHGIELETVWRPTSRWSIDGDYMFVTATVVRFPANRALEGLRVPQVPAHQLTLQSRYATPSGWSFAAQARASSAQFDDDQNLFRLSPYFTLDLFAARKLRRGLEIFAAMENAFDARYDIGRTPVRTTGPPRLVRFGMRFATSAR